MLLAHTLVLFANPFYSGKSTYEYVHSVVIEPTKLILVGTRITYQATGDAGYMEWVTHVSATTAGISSGELCQVHGLSGELLC